MTIILVRSIFLNKRKEDKMYMPKNEEDIIKGTNYHKSITVGDKVTSLVYGLFRGERSTVKQIAQLQYGYFTRLLIETDSGRKFVAEQKNLMYWEDFQKIYKK